MPLSKISFRGNCINLVSCRNYGLFAKFVQGFWLPDCGSPDWKCQVRPVKQQFLALSSEQQTTSLIKNQGPYNPHSSRVTAVNQGTEGCHLGHCLPLHCSQPPVAEGFPWQKVSGGASPSLTPLSAPACSAAAGDKFSDNGENLKKKKQNHTKTQNKTTLHLFQAGKTSWSVASLPPHY